ncbi:MAG TPA: hypothetical protein VIG79_15215 [Lapillicoccus sp.]|uniref:hypothetical protein n=1 Tax=Lapillicoccus sp. TaxID=1909287 RepID=UPI002F94358D
MAGHDKDGADDNRPLDELGGVPQECRHPLGRTLFLTVDLRIPGLIVNHSASIPASAGRGAGMSVTFRAAEQEITRLTRGE